MKILFLFSLASIGWCLQSIPYENFQVYRVTPLNTKQLTVLQQLENNPAYTFWKDVTGINRSADIMVAPHLQRVFYQFLKTEGFQYKIVIENVQDVINNGGHLQKSTRANFNWTAYQDLDSVNDWLESLPIKYPGIVSIVEGGVSYEGRKILGVRVSYGPGKKLSFLEGGSHAREWIAITTVTYMLNQLLESDDSKVRAVAESRDWYVFPIINPDGYEYTKIDRAWRKTRKPYGGVCFGADPNRNWGYKWMEGGASNFPCVETFGGSAAFSEIETKSLSQYISTIADNLEVYLGFHAYSQLLLIPFGHRGLEVPANDDELHKIGKIAITKLAEKYGTQYEVGNIPVVIYVASGSSPDWVLGTYRHVRLVYTFELRDKGQNGFILPPSQIIPTGRETLDAVVAMIEEINK